MKYFLFLALAIVLSALLATGYLEYQAAYGHGPVREPQTFSLSGGLGVRGLGAALEEKGIISSRYAFMWEVATERASRRLIAGEYELSGAETVQEILRKFTQGETVSRDIKVTFPEGWPVHLMADRLTKYGLPGAEFAEIAAKPHETWGAEFPFLAGNPRGASLEGFLFPDTYQFDPEVTGEDIVRTMLENFQRKLGTEIEAQARAHGRTLFQVVTLASIVEEEGRTEKDRGMIADVFWKRLAIGQPFQSDATVNYVLGTFKDQPTLADLETDSPYNTYRYAGLPPGPISNPGLMSLRAAANPTPNPYYYFLNHLETREMYYAETYEQHLENRRQHGL